MSKSLICLLVCLLSSFTVAQSELDVINIQGGSEETVGFRKVDEGEKISFEVLFPNSSNSSVSILNSPKGAAFNGRTFIWRPGSSQSGLYEIHFYGVSVAGGTTHTVYKTIIILVADTRFVIAEKQLFQRLFTATDPDDDRVEISVNNLPAGATFIGEQYGPKLFRWTPTEQQKGKYPMTVVATDYPINGEPKTDVSYLIITVAKRGEIKYGMGIETASKMAMLQALARGWLDEQG